MKRLARELFSQYWARGVAVSTPESLAEAANEVGLVLSVSGKTIPIFEKINPFLKFAVVRADGVAMHQATLTEVKGHMHNFMSRIRFERFSPALAAGCGGDSSGPKDIEQGSVTDPDVGLVDAV